MKFRFHRRFLIYLSILAYLCLDLFSFKGPISRWMGSLNTETTEVNGSPLIATVNAAPITQAMIEGEARRYAYVRAQSLEQFDARQWKEVMSIALETLIERELIRQFSEFNPLEDGVSDEALLSYPKERFEKLLFSEEDRANRLEAQGFDQENWDRYLREERRQYRWLDAKMAPGLEISDEDIKDWLESNPSFRILPEARQIRHVFLSRHFPEKPQDRESEIEAIYTQLVGGEEADWEKIAREKSEDESTSSRGGDLGWMSRERLPDDFAKEVFSLELNQPKIIRTTLGWHVVEMTGRLPEREADGELLEKEVREKIKQERRPKVYRQVILDLRSRSKILYWLERMRKP